MLRTTLLGRTLYTSMSTTVNKQVLQVQHDKKNKLFYIDIPACQDQATLTYEPLGENALDLQHTIVPESCRGQGVGKIIAKAALDYVVENNLKMKLSCWYLQKYVAEHPTEEYLSQSINDY